MLLTAAEAVNSRAKHVCLQHTVTFALKQYVLVTSSAGAGSSCWLEPAAVHRHRLLSLVVCNGWMAVHGYTVSPLDIYGYIAILL
jgi:hypothetical protein